MSDADDAVVLVTGGTSGIGRETVRGLADRGATVLVHGRDRGRGERVCEMVRERTPGAATFYPADFADFDQVRTLAGAVADDHDRLDALVNNAGTWQDERRLTDAVGDRSDGSRVRIELTVAVNHCAHFLLTHRLFPLLDAADGRVVTVSSDLHRRASFDLDALTGPDGPTGRDAYALSKLANVLFTFGLARRAAAAGVTSNACHPGVVPSSRLARDSSGLSSLVWKAFGALGARIPIGPVVDEREAARTSVYLAASDDVAGTTGQYFADREPRSAAPSASDRERQDALWEWTADATDVDARLPGVPHSSSG
ncbi:NAD(P)-dependent dehydrogenase, short-chain alcohol dehydrogenase family [Halomicrobium zhouii]|uniref:NAD(P)-dependent dehydrogenase, short-chain alcohol dehydrogenase family n=1 Tax=Halomicrobium zhouii TaxID=767519 RepID=A0A1I6M6Q0_9EURY|nr:SDR family NAD(P)-dependent oxidoreductase [Halomicrobium zhouii]SFS11400.1 NAD(P)-dependent dehydrogenase, short-chain alcohol dehydrogenase family [Halomicrobium zhouii]